MRRHSFALLLAATACSGKQVDETDPPTFDTAVACAEDDDCGEGRICGDDEICELGDRDNSFDDAQDLRFNEPISGLIAPAGDQDNYRFETLSPGQWVAIDTRNEREDADDLDTIVELFQPNGLAHGVMDNYDIHFLAASDTRLIAYLPTAGEWLVRVRDASEYYGGEARGALNYDYEIELSTFTSVVTEGEPEVLDLDSANSIYTRAFLFATDGDTDEVQIDIPWDDRLILLSGGTGMPGSKAVPSIEVLRDGVTVAHQTNLSDGRWLHIFRSQQGRYTVRATDRDGGGSQDHWFVLYLRTYEADASIAFWATSTYDYELEPNDTRGDASSSIEVTEQTTGGSDYFINRIEGTLDTTGDEDWYSFTARRNLISPRCYAERFGSLADLAFDIVDDEGNILQTVTEYDGRSTPEFYNFDAGASGGTFHLRIYGEDEVAGAPAFYRCQIITTDWMVPDPAAP